MRKHDAHVKEYFWRMRLKSRYPCLKDAVFVFIFFIFVMGIYLGYSYAFYANDLFNCLK